MSDPKYRYDTTLIDEIHTKQFADEIRERINDVNILIVLLANDNQSTLYILCM